MADVERGSAQRPDTTSAVSVASDDISAPEDERTPNPWVVAPTAAAGLGAIIFAGNPSWFGQKSWPSVVEAAFVEFGTALIIAAILVFLEPRFTKKVQKEVRRAAENAALIAQQPLTNAVRDLRQRVNTLTEETEALLRARDEQTDQALAALTESPSFETVTKVLETANDLNVLADGVATVQGGTDPADDTDVDLDNPLSIRVRFLWGSDPGSPAPKLIVQAVCGQSQYLYATEGIPQEDVAVDNSDYKCGEIEWKPTDSAAQVGEKIVKTVESKNLGRGDRTLNWGEAISELGRAIGVAVASRRGTAGRRWPASALFELVGNDWAITESGLEYKHKEEFGPVLYPDDFPAVFPGGQDYNEDYKKPSIPPGQPEPPERMLIRAAAYLPIRHSPNTPAGWQPQRSGM